MREILKLNSTEVIVADETMRVDLATDWMQRHAQLSVREYTAKAARSILHYVICKEKWLDRPTIDGYYDEARTQPIYSIGYGRRATDQEIAGHYTLRTEQETERTARTLEEYSAEALKSLERWKRVDLQVLKAWPALMSWYYNLGHRQWRQLWKDGQRSFEQVLANITLYNKQGGVTLSGLVNRRAEEYSMLRDAVLQSWIPSEWEELYVRYLR